MGREEERSKEENDEEENDQALNETSYQYLGWACPRPNTELRAQ